MNIKYIKLYVILLILIILLYIYSINTICNSAKSLNYFTYDTKIKGPTIIFIAGTHGNEPSGHKVLTELIHELNNKKIILKKGKIIIIPSLNNCALLLNIRQIPFIGDMNRKYPHLLNTKTKNPITSQIVKLINNADFVLDFHEGWGYNITNSNSVGSSLFPTDTPLSIKLANIVCENINNTISDKNKLFVVLDKNFKKYNIKGTLRYYQNLYKKNYILIETTGQNNIQQIQIRNKQNLIAIKTVLNFFNII